MSIYWFTLLPQYDEMQAMENDGIGFAPILSEEVKASLVANGLIQESDDVVIMGGLQFQGITEVTDA